VTEYQDFLTRKIAEAPTVGISRPGKLPSALKPFQRDITTWALRRGRAAIFAGTGLGKTLMQLSWADAVANHTNGRVLILTPLAVAQQTVAEAAKFSIPGVSYAPCQEDADSRIVITNYDRFERFDVSEFAAIVLDESGIIKAHDSKTRAMLIEACIDVPYKLCCTATPAPNDWIELGNHAEFLSVMSEKEMLAMFFVHDGSMRAHGADEWRLKGHAERPFWEWMASWSVMIRSPADLGYDEPGYILPPLNRRQITVSIEYRPMAGMLFPTEARTMQERLGVRRDSIGERVVAVKQIIDNEEVSCQTGSACGSQNMQIAGRDADTLILPTGQEKQSPGDRPPKTASICGPITEPTKTTGTSALPSNETKSMARAGRNTHPTVITESVSKQNQGTRTKRQSATVESNPPLELIPPNTIGCSNPNGAGVQSVASQTPINEVTASISITATRPESSEDCSAHPAISPSENSATTPTDSPERSNTFWKGDDQWIIWCGLNDEQSALEKIFGDRCISVYGSLDPEEKTARILSWLRGERPILISKIRICGYGMNLQQCNKMIFVGMNDSFEQLYQATRRVWRFGQSRPVNVYLIASELDGAVVANIARKEAAFEKMQAAMADHMLDLTRKAVSTGRVQHSTYRATKTLQVPSWMTA
jgi:hypothetical protein